MSPWTILYCKRHDGFAPHIDAIKLSNPHHQLVVLETKNNYPNYRAWMECDLILKPAIKKALPQILHHNIALLEWDVLLLDTLPDINVEFLYANDIYYKGGPWIPGALKYFRNTDYEKFVVCASRFCFYMMPKYALEIWIDKKNDHWFNKSMSCEVRLPTLLNYNGIKPKKFVWPYLIKGKNTAPSVSGKNIYHPILEKLSKNILEKHFYIDTFNTVFNITNHDT